MLEFPRWKYALILVVVLLSALYASPNLFQKDPAVQVTRNRAAAVVDEALASRVRSILDEAGITTGTVELEGDQVLVRLPDAGTQTLAADALRPALGEDYSAALNLVPTTPAWLEALGARPMSLGLDLQGGVHFMMQVDQQAALEKRVDAYADAIRVALRDARIGYTSAERRPDASVLVTIIETHELRELQIPELASSNFRIRQAGERQAMNAGIPPDHEARHLAQEFRTRQGIRKAVGQLAGIRAARAGCDAIAGFHHGDVMALLRQVPRCHNAGHPGAEHEYTLFHVAAEICGYSE